MSFSGKKFTKKIEYLKQSLKVSLDRHGISRHATQISKERILDEGKMSVVREVLAAIFLIILFLIQLPFVLMVNLSLLVQAKLYGIPFVIEPPPLPPAKRIGCIDNKIKNEIRYREHALPHFHVIIDDSDYSILIMTGEVIQGEIKNKGQRTAIKGWYEKNRQLLIKTSNESRPRDCSVGKINETDTIKI